MGHRRSEKRRGSYAVELAILLPLLIFLLVIAIDFARVFYYSQIVQNCARNGAAYASDPQAPAYALYSSVQQAALADATNLSPHPTVTSTTSTNASGTSFVAVTATWQFNTITGFPGVPQQVSLSRTVTMQMAP